MTSLLFFLIFSGAGLIVIYGMKWRDELAIAVLTARKAGGNPTLATHAWMGENPWKGLAVQLVMHAQGYVLREPDHETRMALRAARKAGQS